MASWHNRPKIQISKVDDATIPARLDAVIGNSAVSAGDKQFCESLKQGWNKYKSLTSGQYGALQKCELRYDASAIANNAAEQQKRNDWIANFDNNKRAILNICAQYYSKTPYFKDLADKVIVDPAFTPSEKQYRAMCENKYALRLVENVKNPAKYNVGDLVVLRETARRRFMYNAIATDVPYVILEITENVSSSKGSRQYSVLAIGEADKMVLEEKDIKPYREIQEKRNTRET
jgi:hypothetical protein